MKTTSLRRTIALTTSILAASAATTLAARSAEACTTFSGVAAAPQADNAMRVDVMFNTGAGPAGSAVIQYRKLAGGSWTSTTAFPFAPMVGMQRTLWGLEPNTTYAVRIQEAGGCSATTPVLVTTGSMPAGFPQMDIRTSTSACTMSGQTGCYDSDSPYVLFVAKMDASDPTYPGYDVIIVADRAGDVVWYQLAPSSSEHFQVATFTDDGTVVALEGTEYVYEYLPTGALTTGTPLELDYQASHEVFRDGDVIYTLGADNHGGVVSSYIGDLIQGYDSASATFGAPWRLDTAFTAPADYGNQTCGGSAWDDRWELLADCDGVLGTPVQVRDWSHGNSINLYKGSNAAFTDTALVSLRVFYDHSKGTTEGLIALADLATGGTRWVLGATGDFTLTGGVSTTWFEHQHHATFIGDSTIMVYDNTGGGTTRVLWMYLNPAVNPKLASITREQYLSAYPRGGATAANVTCPVMGSAYLTASLDNIMANCPETRQVMEYDSAGSIVWQLDVLNAFGAPNATKPYRVQPITSFPSP